MPADVNPDANPNVSGESKSIELVRRRFLEIAVYQVEPLDRDHLDDILREYVCSTCWGGLSFRHEDGKWYAICPECGEGTKGYTSKTFAERKRQESDGELFEAERNLRKILGLAHERQTVAQNLRDLGF